MPVLLRWGCSAFQLGHSCPSWSLIVLNGTLCLFIDTSREAPVCPDLFYGYLFQLRDSLVFAVDGLTVVIVSDPQRLDQTQIIVIKQLQILNFPFILINFLHLQFKGVLQAAVFCFFLLNLTHKFKFILLKTWVLKDDALMFMNTTSLKRNNDLSVGFEHWFVLLELRCPD